MIDPNCIVDKEVVRIFGGRYSGARFKLNWFPLQPKSLTLILSSENGALLSILLDAVGDGKFFSNFVKGTVNYSTGVVQVTFASPPPKGTYLTASYEYDPIPKGPLPQIDLVLTSSLVVEKTRKLEPGWTVDEETELEVVLGGEIKVTLEDLT
jgi:hypothetical protein